LANLDYPFMSCHLDTLAFVLSNNESILFFLNEDNIELYQNRNCRKFNFKAGQQLVAYQNALSN
jgi:hypothetical protein